jgi:hypothetical protein
LNFGPVVRSTAAQPAPGNGEDNQLRFERCETSRLPVPTELSQPLQLVRYLVDRSIVLPAARRLPLRSALIVAQVVGFVDAALPSRATRSVSREMGAATGTTGLARFRKVAASLATQREELVYLTRMGEGREHLADWDVFESNREGVAQLIAEGRSFILAGAHFPHAAANVAQKVLPSPAAFVGGDGPASAGSAAERRRSHIVRARDRSRAGLFGALIPPEKLLISVPDVWRPGADWRASGERVKTVKRMLSQLANPGGLVLIRVDVHWEGPGAYCRPFAGTASRGFALGAASTARLAQCPVVPFTAVLGHKPRTVLLGWGDVIFPPPRHAQHLDTAVLDAVLNHLERGIGRYPTQYQAPVGLDRAWNRHSESWEPSSRRPLGLVPGSVAEEV